MTPTLRAILAALNRNHHARKANDPMRLRITDHTGPRVVLSTASGVEVTFIPHKTADRDPAALLDCELPTLESFTFVDRLTHVGSAADAPSDASPTPDDDQAAPVDWRASVDWEAFAERREAECSRWRDRAEQAEAAIALLREGEEPRLDDRVVATAAEWIWLWNRATPADRLAVAAQIQETANRADNAEAAIRRVREHYGDSGSRMVNVRQILGLLSPTWPDGNYSNEPGPLDA